MKWIETSLEMSFGGEDGGEDIAVEFNGWYGAAHPALRSARGDIYEPASPATFEISQVRWRLDGAHWTEMPGAYLTPKLLSQLERIGIAVNEAPARRMLELEPTVAALEAQWVPPLAAE